MSKLTPDSLLTLEAYSKVRPQFRQEAIVHKNARKVFVGPNVLLQFEDEQTIAYQIQEVLRVEKTFEEAGILEELDAYNPLIPDGTNWKATMMIEFTDIEVRKQKLVELRGIERQVYVQVGQYPKVYAIADEDLPRENDEKTSAVHFLRFELTPAMIEAVKQDADIAVGVDHSAYQYHLGDINPQTKQLLIADLA